MDQIKNELIQRQKKYFGQAGAWLLLVYATLPIARPISEFLRKTGYFSFGINALFLIVIAGIFYFFFRKIRLRSTYILLGFLCLITWAILAIIKIPEEKIHFLQYGFLSFLIYRAFRVRANERVAYLFAFVLTALFGWGDEGIQYLLPDRYYDLRDVIFNVLGGMLGLLTTFTIRREKA